MHGPSEITDQMVSAAALGSKEELDRLALAVAPQTHLMVMARLSPTPAQFHAVEDITQSALAALAAGLGALDRQTVAGLRAFLSGIVAHKVSDYLRQRPGRERGGPSVASLDSTLAGFSQAGPLWQFLSQSGTSPPSAADRDERLRSVMVELGQLKPEYREVITLAFFDQLPTADIAARVGVSRSAASMLLIRAVKALRRTVTGSSQVQRRIPDEP